LRAGTLKKKRYSPPELKELTLEQAKKLIAKHKNYTEEELAEFLKSLRSQNRQSKRAQDHRENDKNKRSA